MPLGFGSIKDIARVIKWPLWIVSGAVALYFLKKTFWG